MVEAGLRHQLLRGLPDLEEDGLDRLHSVLRVPIGARLVGQGEVVADVVKAQELAELGPKAGPAVTEHQGGAVECV